MTITFNGDNYLEMKKTNIISTFLPDKKDDLVFNEIAEAAFYEYMAMFNGERNFSTVAQINQYRLLILIRHVFKGIIPSEDQVSTIFKISIQASRALIRNTKALFAFELKDSLLKTFKAILSTIDLNKDKSGDYYKVTIRSNSIVSEMNQILKVEHPELEPIKKLNEATQFFKISEQLYNTFK